MAAVKKIEARIEDCKIKLAAEGVKAKWQPDEEALEACRELARTVAAAPASS